ncbi:glycosyltransferase [Dyadobacter sp. LJ53]|uniref:glycosyltransferase family 4 protein n=1 Tax=Dyadobacter chenwenxiniae TaxID=2906456 RepID=UPI001F37C200|nr:glycosyltransferase [Dyadobacter chenwenxiniae]MCF0048469.1 glycosyltransferase [Dyadobacter chenwenxiniae]
MHPEHKKQNSKRKITWVTPDYFVDCDFNIEIFKHILRSYDVHWIILLPGKNARFSENDFSELQKLDGLHIEFLYSFHRQRDPRRLGYYLNLLRKINNDNSDVNYFNCVPDPYSMPIFWLLNKRKTIFCAHDGEVTGAFSFATITKLAFKYSYSYTRFVNMFSKSQAQKFKVHYPDSKIFTTYLALKSFGESTPAEEQKNKITFLSFGVINYSKNIEMLIQAACNIYEQGYRNFKVSINGTCANWEYYQEFIRYPELFECQIRMIANNEIPELFSNASYFVQPYRQVSQSGAMKVAFQYNLPVIASDFPGFRDEIVEGVNGYLFDSSDVKNLEKLMIERLEKHDNEYDNLKIRMRKLIEKRYSNAGLAQNYISMFNQVIDSAHATA